MKILVVLSLIFVCVIGFGQNNNQLNLEKYWRYRERLRNEFIVVTDNVENFGVNIPAAAIFRNADYAKVSVDWDDANSNMSHYLSVLATEYRLLKNNGQNYNETLEELYYALLAIERLDMYSEFSIRERENSGTGFVDNTLDRNGWFIRDDINQEFWDNNYSHFGFQNSNINNFHSMYTDPVFNMESISQDNIYHLLEGLALIRKLVDSEPIGEIPVTFTNSYTPDMLSHMGIISGNNCNFSDWAKNITDRVIRQMQHRSPMYLFNEPGNPYQCDFEVNWWDFVWLPIVIAENIICSINTHWYIKNPVTNKLAKEGAGDDFDTHYFYSYGLARAGNWISDYSNQYHFNNSDDNLHEEVFFNILNGNYNAAVNSLNSAFSASIAVTTVVFSVVDGGIKNSLSSKVLIQQYDDYKIRTLATIANAGGINTFNMLRDKRPSSPYEHFPLIWLSLHKDDYSNIYLPSSSEYQTDKLYYQDLLDSAPCSGPKSYNILDEYDLNWSSISRLVWPERLGKLYNYNIDYNGLDYMLLHNLYCLSYSQDFRKLTVEVIEDYNNQTITETAVDLFATNTISGGDVTYQASNSIRLLSGFKTTPGTAFQAIIVPSVIDYSGCSQFNSCVILNPTIYSKSKSIGECNEDSFLLDSLESWISDRNIELIPTSISEKKRYENSVSLYPNPNKGSFSISLNSNSINMNKLQIRNSVGLLIYTAEFEGNTTHVMMPYNTKGMFILSVISDNHQYQTKIIVE